MGYCDYKKDISFNSSIAIGYLNIFSDILQFVILLIASIAYAQETGNDGFADKHSFDVDSKAHHAAHGHEEHHDHYNSVPAAQGIGAAREARQRNRNRNRGSGNRGSGNRGGNQGGGAAAAAGGNPTFDQVAAAGERCIDKIEMTEVTEYDDEVTCKHSYSEQCHQSYVTDYKPAQKEQCEEEFIKNCHIKYQKKATKETVRKCSQQLVCAGEGPTVCRTAHTTACETRLEVHEVDDDIVNCRNEFETSCEDVTQGYSTTTECKKWPKVKCDKKTEKTRKTNPITECRTVPTQVCGPEGCILEKGEEFCVDEVQTVINPVSTIIHLILTYSC